MSIRKLIMYSHGIETQWFFSRQLAAEFEKLGYEVFFFDPDDAGEEELIKLKEFIDPTGCGCSEEPDLREKCSAGSDGMGDIPVDHGVASVGFNFSGSSGEDCMYDEKEIHIYDKYHIPMINIVVDHPFYYHKFEPYLPKENYIQCSIDTEHEEYLKRFFPNIERGSMIPLAGTDLAYASWDQEGRTEASDVEGHKSADPGGVSETPGAVGHSSADVVSRAGADSLPGWDTRPIDIMFAGNYNPPEKQDELLKRNGPEYEAFYHDLIDDLIANPEMEMTFAIEKHIREGGFEDEITEESLKEIFPYMIVIDLYVRHYFRGEAVRILADAGIPVHVFGSGWTELKTAYPENVISHGLVDSYACLEAARSSKLSLNVMPWFKHGAHDRVFNSMLNGSVCITDPSTYLEQEFTHGENIYFYSLRQPALAELPNIVTDALSDRDRWYKMQQSAYTICKQHHCWSMRADKIHTDILSHL